MNGCAAVLVMAIAQMGAAIHEGQAHIAGEFQIPAVPGWTDVSSGAPEANFRKLSSDQLSMVRGGSYAVFEIDLRGPSTDFRPNCNVLLLDTVLPIQKEVAERLARTAAARLNAVLRSAEVVTRPGEPRIKFVMDMMVNTNEVRMVQVLIPGQRQTALVSYALGRKTAARYLPAIDDHSSRIRRLPSGDGTPGALDDEGSAQALLCQGARNGDIPLMRRALANGADINAESGLTTPLAWAAREGQVGAADFLLEHGARINQHHGLPKRTPLQEAALNGRTEMVRFLVESGADLNARNKFGRTALFYAVSPAPPLTRSANSEEIARYLRSKGATQ